VPSGGRSAFSLFEGEQTCRTRAEKRRKSEIMSSICLVSLAKLVMLH
jgi:hypothetical protein